MSENDFFAWAGLCDQETREWGLWTNRASQIGHEYELRHFSEPRFIVYGSTLNEVGRKAREQLVAEAAAG